MKAIRALSWCESRNRRQRRENPNESLDMTMKSEKRMKPVRSHSLLGRERRRHGGEQEEASGSQTDNHKQKEKHGKKAPREEKRRRKEGREGMKWEKEKPAIRRLKPQASWLPPTPLGQAGKPPSLPTPEKGEEKADYRPGKAQVKRKYWRSLRESEGEGEGEAQKWACPGSQPGKWSPSWNLSSSIILKQQAEIWHDRQNIRKKHVSMPQYQWKAGIRLFNSIWGGKWQ